MTGTRDKTHEPKAHNAYMTIDPRPIPALLRHFQLRGTILEPACGKLHMVNALTGAGHLVLPMDLIDHTGSLPAEHLRDFRLMTEAPPNVRAVVTNPPNDLNLAFALHALKLMEPVRGQVALFQRVAWDTAKKTAPIFDHPAYAMKIICRFRPRWFEHVPGTKKKNPFHIWAWYCWDFRHSGPPVMRFA
jgi:hypothetical protein